MTVVLFAAGLNGLPASARSADDELDRAIECDPFEHSGDVVLLVHGTTLTGPEHWNLNYRPMLREHGRDVCVVTYPHRGLGDQQDSAEVIAHAVLRVHQRAGRKVDIVGHSQGAILPRWAVKYWGSAQRVVNDLVMLAGPQHGFSSSHLLLGPRPAPFWQWRFDSAFMHALNSGDETPGDVDYTSIYSAGDEGVQPMRTAMLDGGRDSAHVTNVATQDVCPARPVDHATIGTTDALTHELVLDALRHAGPLDIRRLPARSALCAIPDGYVAPDSVRAALMLLPEVLQRGVPAVRLEWREPPLKPYAR